MKCTRLPCNGWLVISRTEHLFVVPNVPTDPPTASVPIITLLCNGPLLLVIAYIVSCVHQPMCPNGTTRCVLDLNKLPARRGFNSRVCRMICINIDALHANFHMDGQWERNCAWIFDTGRLDALSFRNGTRCQNFKTFYLERLWFIFLSTNTFCPPYT